jgi:Ca2+-binding EF-hand superfamily protein
MGTAAEPASSSTAPAPAALGEDDHHGKHGGHHHGGLFRRFDENGDGKVALADLPEPMRERFKDADTNADGVLTRDEVKAFRAAHHAKMEADLDTNGDGVVSDDERKAGREKFEEMWQKRLDTNGDGVVSDDERKAAREKFRDMWIARHDMNHDGALSADEVGPKVWSRISTADANKDGRVDRAEMATLPERPHRRPFSG